MDKSRDRKTEKARRRYRIGKRILDIAVSVPGLVIALPLLALAALLVAYDLGRPVLFRQTRIGLCGKPFVMVKFRTMREAAGPDGTPLPDKDRLTRLGQFLRASSLDELPELWNILRGDMSIVGPRPLPPEYLPWYSPRHARRHEVHPGLTGLAQVNGRNGLDWHARFELDLEYIEKQSLFLDMKIIFRTVGVLIKSANLSMHDPARLPRFDDFMLAQQQRSRSADGDGDCKTNTTDTA